LAFVLKTLASLSVLQVLFGFVGLFLVFLIPAAVVAFFKLRNRDLSAVLEGNTWGVNARMKLTRSQAKQFTQAPRHPGHLGKSTGPLLAFGLLVFLGFLAYYLWNNYHFLIS
jgi:hypothetical protein